MTEKKTEPEPITQGDWKTIMSAIMAGSWQGSAVEHIAALKSKVQQRIDND